MIAYYKDSNATTLTDILVRATVYAIKHFRQYSLEFDADRTTYQQFDSYSPQETKPIRGHIFRMYSKQAVKNDIVGNLGNQLYIGMPLCEIKRLLGEPSGMNPGTEMLEAGPRGKVVVSEETRTRLAQTVYYMWKRPEGIYLLVIENDRLARIYSKP